MHPGTINGPEPGPSLAMTGLVLGWFSNRPGTTSSRAWRFNWSQALLVKWCALPWQAGSGHPPAKQKRDYLKIVPGTRKVGCRSTFAGADQPPLDRQFGRLATAADLQLVKDVVHVILHRMLRNMQLGPDFFVGGAGDDQA